MSEALSDSEPLEVRRPRLTISPALAQGIRAGVAFSAAIWIAKVPGLVDNDATWILITVAVLLQPTMGSTLLKGIARLAGTLAAVITAILLFGLFAQDPPFMVASFFLVQAVAAYGNSGRRFRWRRCHLCLGTIGLLLLGRRGLRLRSNRRLFPYVGAFSELLLQ